MKPPLMVPPLRNHCLLEVRLLLGSQSTRLSYWERLLSAERLSITPVMLRVLMPTPSATSAWMSAASPARKVPPRLIVLFETHMVPRSLPLPAFHAPPRLSVPPSVAATPTTWPSNCCGKYCHEPPPPTVRVPVSARSRALKLLLPTRPLPEAVRIRVLDESSTASMVPSSSQLATLRMMAPPESLAIVAPPLTTSMDTPSEAPFAVMVPL